MLVCYRRFSSDRHCLQISNAQQDTAGKMTDNNQRIYSKFGFLIVVLLCANFSYAKLKSPEKSFDFLNFEEIKYDLFSKRNYDFPNIQQDNLQCFTELMAIRSGLIEHEEWAIKSK